MGVMHGFAGRPPGTLWVPAFDVEAEGFSPAAGWRTTRAAGLKPSASSTKPYGLKTDRAKPCIRVGGTKSRVLPNVATALDRGVADSLSLSWCGKIRIGGRTTVRAVP